MVLAWFIPLTVVFVLLLFWEIAQVKPILAILSFLAYMAGLQWLSHVPVIQVVIDDPTGTLLYVGLYLIVGVTWSFLRWWLYIRQVFSGRRTNEDLPFTNFVGYKEKWLHDRRLKQETEERRRQRSGQETGDNETHQTMQQEWLKHLQEILPKANKNKSLISLWIIYWPFSMLWSIMEDLVREIIKWVVTKLRAVYDSIGESALKGMSPE